MCQHLTKKKKPIQLYTFVVQILASPNFLHVAVHVLFSSVHHGTGRWTAAARGGLCRRRSHCSEAGQPGLRGRGCSADRRLRSQWNKDGHVQSEHHAYGQFGFVVLVSLRPCLLFARWHYGPGARRSWVDYPDSVRLPLKPVDKGCVCFCRIRLAWLYTVLSKAHSSGHNTYIPLDTICP